MLSKELLGQLLEERALIIHTDLSALNHVTQSIQLSHSFPPSNLLLIKQLWNQTTTILFGHRIALALASMSVAFAKNTRMASSTPVHIATCIAHTKGFRISARKRHIVMACLTPTSSDLAPPSTAHSFGMTLNESGALQLPESHIKRLWRSAGWTSAAILDMILFALDPVVNSANQFSDPLLAVGTNEVNTPPLIPRDRLKAAWGKKLAPKTTIPSSCATGLVLEASILQLI